MISKKYGPALVVLLVILYMAAPLYPPDMIHPESAFLPPSSAHLMGTDPLGRDLWSLLIYGLWRTLTAVLLGSAVSLFIGFLLGMTAGASGSSLRSVILSVTDLTLIIPPFLCALILSSLWGMTPVTAGLALGFFDIGIYVNQTCALTQRLMNSDFIQSEKALGCSYSRILFLHIFPHLAPSVLTLFGSRASSLVLQYAGLTFIGAGGNFSMPDWGSILYQYRMYAAGFPRLVFFPLIFIFVLAVTFHLLFDQISEKRFRRS